MENEENRDINPLADINEAINTSETEASENIWVNIAGTEESAKSEAAEDIEATYIEEEGYSTAGVLPGGLSDLNTPEHSKGFCKV